jgi:hypothetical protein
MVEDLDSDGGVIGSVMVSIGGLMDELVRAWRIGLVEVGG